MSAIEPTLFIGLGGAGGNVLGRLRSLFALEFGPMGGRESPVQFLLLDADDFQKLDPPVKETLSEQDEFMSLSHFNPRHYIDEHRRDHRSDLNRWFDWDARPLLADEFVRDGASRLRMLGRLCLHRSYYEVEKIISEKISRAKSARAYVTEGERIRKSERPFRVVIVGSTCGGTGSGIFLDIVHMVNQLVRSTGATPDVTAFLLLPFWFIEKNRAVDTDLVPYYRANAWAFFEELNYVLLRPSRLAELALAPNRAAVDAELVHADYEPLKAVYLLDSEIPNVGRFDDPNDWHTYISRGIYQLYLTAGEESLDSVFSNVKTKLGETDGRYGLRKRFASLGYADLRHPGPQLRQWLQERSAIEFVRERLLATPEEAQVSAAVSELLSVLDQEVISAELNKLERDQWPKLDPADFQRNLGRAVEANLSSLSKLGQQVQSEIDQFNRKLPTQADLDSAVARARDLLRKRATRLTLGLVAESKVLERVHAALWEGLDQSEEADGIEPLAFTTDVRKLKGVEEGEAAATKKSLFGGPSKSPGDYKSYITDVNNSLDQKLATWHEKEIRVRRRYLVQRIAGKLNDGHWLDWTRAGEQAMPSAMGEVRDRLLAAASALQRRVQPSEVRLNQIQKRASLTSQFSPALGSHEQVWKRYRRSYVALCGDQPRVDALMETLASDLLALDAGEAQRGGALDLVMGRLRDFFEAAFGRTYDLLADIEAAEDRTAVLQLQNLYGLSAPCCRIDGSKLALGDTTPRVLVAAGGGTQKQVSALVELASREHVPQTEWAFSDEPVSALQVAGDGPATAGMVQALLQLPSPPGLTKNDGSRFALLQAVYAFPSYAIAGMNTLRSAYDFRDRKRSFPHIQREWNQKGLRVSRQGELTDGELLKFGRMRALSDLFFSTLGPDAPAANGKNGNGAGPAGTIPVHHLRFDSDGAHAKEGPWLLRYQKGSDGRMYLRARSADPVPDHVGVWRLASDAEDLHEFNLDQNVRSYIASSAHLSHERLLSTDVEELENGSDAKVFAEAYLAYAERVERGAEHWQAKQRVSDAQLHRRLSAALRRYAAGLVVEDGPEL